MAAVIRPATPADLQRIGEIHVAAWQATYRGVMPDEFLDGLDPGQRATMWARFFEAPPPGGHLDVVLDADGDVAGWASYGNDRDAAPATGELHAVNLDPAMWGRGLGGALIGHVADALAVADERFDEAVLWVVPSNDRARAVYERLGWRPDGAARRDTVLDAVVDEVRYRIDLTARR